MKLSIPRIVVLGAIAAGLMLAAIPSPWGVVSVLTLTVLVLGEIVLYEWQRMS